MAIAKKIQNVLNGARGKSEIISHRKVYTMYDLAQTLRHPFESIAKTLLIKVDKAYMLVVMPANYRLDEKKLKKVLGAKKVSFATERDMKNKLHVKPGAIVPFGQLHKLDVLVDKSLLKVKEALFSAGTFTESIRMKVKDYITLVEPQVVQIAKKVPMKLTAKPKSKTKKRKTKKKPVQKKNRAQNVKKKSSTKSRGRKSSAKKTSRKKKI